MKIRMKKLGLLLIIFLLFFLVSCFETMKVPKNYVKDEQIVYLNQKTDLKPIIYDLLTVDPYPWDKEISINKESPDFLKFSNLKPLINPDYYNDQKTYKEIREHLSTIYDSDLFKSMKQLADQSDKIEKPQPAPLETGDVVKEYNNAVEYIYPPVKDATIILFENGDYKILYPDKSFFYYSVVQGYYFMKDNNGEELYFVAPEEEFRIIMDGYNYDIFSNYVKVEDENCSFIHSTKEDPQYILKYKNKIYHYVFFYEKNGKIAEYTIVNDKYSLRFDYFSQTENCVINDGKSCFVITKNYEKTYHIFNTEKREPGKMLAIYTKEGFKFTGFDDKLSYSEFTPGYPLTYKKIMLSGFNIYYTDKDSKLIKKLNSSLLSKLISHISQITGIQLKPGRAIIIPPDLETYCRIAAQKKNTKFRWYPSGYAFRDIIIAWPLSVPRYQSEEGETYFWEEEIYQILVHELLHAGISENTNLFSYIPTWLNEGLALYAETRWSETSKSYWDTTFLGTYYLKKMISWDDASRKSTQDFPIAEARSLYAQSYGMVSYLMEKYGKDQVLKYILSFKLNFDELLNTNPDQYSQKADYIILFEQIFNITWEENLKNFDEYAKSLDTQNK